MGLIARVFDVIFGHNRNVLRETAEVFRENREKAAVRDQVRGATAMAQFSGEFLPGSRGKFDRLMDAVNRLPRPMMALGCLGLFGSAMVDPIWFAARMEGIALVPEPLWWLLGVIVSFYFGARHQMKGQAFQNSLATSLAQVAAYQARTTAGPEEFQNLDGADGNAALVDWDAVRSR